MEFDIYEGEGPVSTELVFYVNGKKIIEPAPDPDWTLLWYLRKKLKLTGTKLGCAEGGCGSCTVMISKYNRHDDHVTHFAINACLTPVCTVHGLAITTVEGIGSTKTKLHPVQERLAKAHGSQCGFCTPGMVMSMYSLIRANPKIEYSDLETTFQGNLCRCTGYRSIIDGYKTFVEDWENQRVHIKESQGCPMGSDCCKNKNEKDSESEFIFDKSTFVPYDPTQEPIFPPELKLSSKYNEQFLLFRGQKAILYRPTKIETLLTIKHKYPYAKIVVGNTELGVEKKFKHFIYPIIVSPNSIPELNLIKKTESSLIIGAAVSFKDVEATFKNHIKSSPKYMIRSLQCILKMLNYFAGKQIKNVASFGGNIMTGSPISDLNPILMALNTKLNVVSKQNGNRYIYMDEQFFTDYRKNIIADNEILVSIEIPFTNEFQYIKALKQSKRREDDISIVTAAVNVNFVKETNIIDNIKIVFGGMAPVTKIAIKTNQILKGLQWNEEMLETAYNAIMLEFPLHPSVPGGNVMYRKALTMSLFFKVYMSISNSLYPNNLQSNTIDRFYFSGCSQFTSKIPKTSQYFDLVDYKQVKSDAVGRPIPHKTAIQQTTGEAIYVDDMPIVDGELYLAFILSKHCYAKIISIDASNALNQPGVIAFYSAKDLFLEQNKISNDEELFANKEVICQGQTIAIIIANNQIIAQEAAKKVKVIYEEMHPQIITIEDAIKYESYFPSPYPLEVKTGDVQSVFKNKNNIIIENEYRIGGQEHFYFETQTALAVPKKEDDEMELFCSTQYPSQIAKLTGKVLNIPNNRIVVKVKRIGGGFGGKETRSMLVAIPVAFAAYKLQRPVRCMLDRDEDMQMTGGRHPFLMKYKVAVSKEGKILALSAKFYSNAGCSADLSNGVMLMAMLSADNSYNIPNMEIFGLVCKTNLPSNTAFRGFGCPQAMFGIENIIRNIALELNKSAEEITEINMYRENMCTPFGQRLENCTLQRCWNECIEKSNISYRKRKIEDFNSMHRWRKRGMAIMPLKYGIGLAEKFLNQAGALVLIYTDGSVLITHGGTEMGQGLHTKIIQIASRALGIDVSKIHITETATDKVPNTMASSASVCSDHNGMAVLDACQKLMKRLQPYIDQNPSDKWEQWISAAYVNRVSLSATGFYATPKVGYNFETKTGQPHTYYTYGAGCTEVEIDCLSGDHQIIRTDIVMDLGTSLNPAIDIGQIEGAFMQGYGLFTMEELIYSPKGELLTRGPGSYKIPGFGDVPHEFNVSLLKGATNPYAIYSSKAVGEPPLLLSLSVFFAIKEAIKAARSEFGAPLQFRLDSPATSARIRMACVDHITNKLEEPDPDSYVPWNVVP